MYQNVANAKYIFFTETKIPDRNALLMAILTGVSDYADVPYVVAIERAHPLLYITTTGYEWFHPRHHTAAPRGSGGAVFVDSGDGVDRWARNHS